MNPAMSPKVENRRSTNRYTVSAPVQYRAAAPTLESVWKSGHTRDMSAGGINPDRRTRLRFPLDMDLRFEISRYGKSISGKGQVVNTSSKALAFRTDGPLYPGMRISVSVAWPAKLDECRLRLVFVGVVLRASDGLVVVTIERPQFRTSREGRGN